MAEDRGWDGFFIWDHVLWRPRSDFSIFDPWVMLGAIACETSRMLIGTMVTPVARRRPWTLARETATVDRLSGGRLVLGVGLGSPDSDFSAFGEDAGLRRRAELLDEGLDVLDLLWQGGGSYEGRRYQVDVTDFGTPPLRGRVPVWVGGYWPSPPPMRRAARYDGAVFLRRGENGGLPGPLDPEEFGRCREQIDRLRTDPAAPFDHAVWGEAGRLSEVQDYERAGATWWLEAPDRELPFAQLRVRTAQGPPV
jgi:alkanesulfonate monooxygenase SsuD/methylene tetrahydromethanopterin reductase-like flavin-dependent oxidoreductase (luciferase family)